MLCCETWHGMAPMKPWGLWFTGHGNEGSPEAETTSGLNSTVEGESIAQFVAELRKRAETRLWSEIDQAIKRQIGRRIAQWTNSKVTTLQEKSRPHKGIRASHLSQNSYQRSQWNAQQIEWGSSPTGEACCTRGATGQITLLSVRENGSLPRPMLLQETNLLRLWQERSHS